MAIPAISPQPLSLRMLATLRRFIRWLTSAKVVLALIMLALMIYMVIVPLYRMVETTMTYQEKDVFYVPDAVVGKLTIFHWTRMLASKISKVMLFVPLQHSLTIAIGASLLAMTIGSTLAWLVIRTDMPGRKLINNLATIPYIMPSWTIAMAWTVMFKNRLAGGTPGIFEYLVGRNPPDWLSYGTVPMLFINWVLNEPGADPWRVIGNYMARTDMPDPEGAIPHAELTAWQIDNKYVYENITQVRDFYMLNLLE